MAEQERSHAVRRGRVARAAPLLGAAGRTAGEAVVASLRGRRDASFHERAAERYAERLGRSKGVLMKAGQLLSFVSFAPALDGDYAPVYRAALARLQDSAPPMPYEDAAAMVKQELGARPEELFAEFSREPIAAASIGQVHAATLEDGRRVAVKVQYPGVEAAIRADLSNTELLVGFFSLARSMAPSLSRMDMRALAAEVSVRIGEELDYRTEAANQAEFAGVYRGHPFVRVPEVVPELCADRVLTMEFADGMRWAKALTAEQDLRDRWGEVVYRFTLGSLRRRGLFHADPHPGNYLFHDDGTVTFLDFGCVKRFTPRQIGQMRAMVTATVDGDASGFSRALLDAGFFPPDDAAPDPAELLSWFQANLHSLVGPQPYTFTPDRGAAAVQAAFSPTGAYGALLRRLTMPADFLFLSRIEMGMSAVLGELHATGEWRGICDEWDRGAPPATPYGELDQDFWRERHVGRSLG
ncbi:ABC1 kinase family protein [Actinomadura rupiterrae]|uniref:ABC1 kinase family protein n=1 Tax=Actinomadura rupiterrae TaxID=559627 RepID=UPI0020A3FDE0|nr:AarF/ABC1/UbiB kinase family protein [Actinomadura rupiterrae]MCP2339012.1 putative unusual protein kinase regulating ubiquinone biosynthesis (AarF/ABC1/UbiB family) [Actinomadura rupiterrae]